LREFKGTRDFKAGSKAGNKIKITFFAMPVRGFERIFYMKLGEN
jgi:hypothetical protein